MDKRKRIEELGGGNYILTTFKDDIDYCFDPGADYLDYSFHRDIPTGEMVSLISIEVKGSLEITGVQLYFPCNGLIRKPLPMSMLLNNPATKDHTIYLSFEPPLDLRAWQTGDVKLCMTITDYKSGDKVFISYGTVIYLKQQ